MELKRDAKLGEKSTCSFKIDIRNFSPEYSNVSKFFTLMGSFWAKYILFELKKIERSYLS